MMAGGHSSHVQFTDALSLSTNTGLQLPQKTVTLAMSGITLFVLMYLLSSIFWWTIFSSGFLCGAHALLRDASMHKDMDDVMAMEGDLHLGEDASFLNAQRVDQV